MKHGYFQAIVLCVAVFSAWFPRAWCSQLGPRDIQELSNEQLATLAAVVDPVKNIDPNDPRSHLSKILVPRPGVLRSCASYTVHYVSDLPRTVGSDNITLVREYIMDVLTSLDWHVEEDTFTDFTPYGERTFTNIIATKDPSSPRRVILSAHYDSKYFPRYPDNQVRSLQHA